MKVLYSCQATREFTQADLEFMIWRAKYEIDLFYDNGLKQKGEFAFSFNFGAGYEDEAPFFGINGDFRFNESKFESFRSRYKSDLEHLKSNWETHFKDHPVHVWFQLYDLDS